MRQGATDFENIFRRFRRRALADPQEPCLARSGLIRSRSEVLLAATSAAEALGREGVGPGDRVLALFGDGPEFAILLLACAEIGAAIVPLPPDHGAHERRVIMQHAGAKVAVGAPADARLAQDNRPSPRVLSFEDLVKKGSKSSERRHDEPGKSGQKDQPLLVLYGSVAAERTRAMLFSQGALAAAATCGRTTLGLKSSDRVESLLPFPSVFGIGGTLLGAMLSGIPVEFQPSADAEAVLSSLARGRVTVLVGTMPSIHLIANDPDAAEYDLRALRLCALSNPICPVALRKEISTNLGAEAMTVNCIDEAGGSVTATQPGDTDEVLAATSGRTVAGVDLRIVNLESGRPVGMNEIGEVVVRSPMSSSGFLSDPEATAALRDDGGFVKTGELGALLSGDHLRLVGRTRDVIRRGGVTVDPADIEEVLKGCDGVGDAAVVGLPDEFLGELICACVVPSPGTASLKPPSLRVACALALSSVKIPDVVVPVDALPTLPDGRVSKSALRSILQGESSG